MMYKKYTISIEILKNISFSNEIITQFRFLVKKMEKMEKKTF